MIKRARFVPTCNGAVQSAMASAPPQKLENVHFQVEPRELCKQSAAFKDLQQNLPFSGKTSNRAAGRQLFPESYVISAKQEVSQTKKATL